MARINKTNTSVGKDVEKPEPSYTAGGSKMMQLLCKAVWQFLKSLNTELSYDLAIQLLGKYPKENTHRQKYLYINVVKNIVYNRQKWKQPRYPFTDG